MPRSICSYRQKVHSHSKFVHEGKEWRTAMLKKEIIMLRVFHVDMWKTYSQAIYETAIKNGE